MTKVKKISVLSLAERYAMIMAIAGLVAGIIYSFGGLLIDSLVSLGWITSSETPGLSIGTVLAFGALIGMPIIFAAFGFVVGTIVAVIRNLISAF